MPEAVASMAAVASKAAVGFITVFSSAAGTLAEGTLAEVGTMQHHIHMGCAITMREDATLHRVSGRNHSQSPHLDSAPLWNAGRAVVGQEPRET
jgi:hypothetical protein